MKPLLSLALLGLALFLSGCSQSGGEAPVSGSGTSGGPDSGGSEAAGETITTGEGSYTRVGPEALRGFIGEREPLVVNTHVPYEGELPATDRFVPYDRISGSPALPEDRDRPIVVYCRSGPMSQQAAETLVGLGYTEVRDLRGGMNAWEAAGLPLRRTDR